MCSNSELIDIVGNVCSTPGSSDNSHDSPERPPSQPQAEAESHSQWQCASEWTRTMAENVLGLTFKAVFDEVPQVGGDDYDRSQFGYWQVFRYALADHYFQADSLAHLDSTISVFERLKNYLYATDDKETCELLLGTWNQKQCKPSDLRSYTGDTVAVPDVAALPEEITNNARGLGLSVKEKMILYQVGRDVQLRDKAVLNARARDNCEKKKFERLGKISKYLNTLYRLIELTSQGNQPSERSFESLFLEYAAVFDVVFRRGDVPGRSMMVFGRRVTSIPEFHLDEKFDKQWMIVTCGEVKKAAKVKSFQESARQLCSHDGHADLENTPDCNDVYLSDAHLGQHAVKLLLELPFSAMKVCGKKDINCVLGLIVQATKVQLTCLAMKQEDIDHLQQCSSDDFTNSQPKKRRGTFYFTQAYDMLNKDDYKHIACILLTLGHVASMDYP